jgi:predicted nucleic acid-binding protein
MNYLLDTCVVSELIKARSDKNVIDWIDALEEHLFLSVLTLGEIEKGIAKLPLSLRKSNLKTWLEQDLVLRFENRILNITPETADIGEIYKVNWKNKVNRCLLLMD